MARPLRIQAPGITYHVTARGNRRTAIFLDEVDRRRFLTLLAGVVRSFRLDCHAYCLMNNHYHAALTTSEPNLSRAIKHLNGTYAQWWNRRHGHVGHLFQGRFGAQIVQHGPYFLAVCRYIVLNPVRAGFVRTPEEWPWSSYRATAGLARAPSCLRRDVLLGSLGNGDPAAACRRYRQFVTSAPIDAPPRAPVIGDPGFAEKLRPWRLRASREVPRREREMRPPLDAVFQGAMTRALRNARVVEAYRVGHSMAEIARYLVVHPSTISRIVRWHEGSDREKS